jgi:hypothetical protein
MTERNSKWLPSLAVAACVACCTIPLAGVFFAGASSTAIATFFASDQWKEVLMCAAAILFMMTGCFIYARCKKAAACCETPKTDCNSNQCSVDTQKK